MNVRIASEAWICRSFGQPSESRLWVLIWISSWDPLKLCDAIRRTTSAPPGQNPAGQDLEASLSRSPSHDSNAPIKPKSQSNLSNIVARLTAIRGCIGPCPARQLAGLGRLTPKEFAAADPDQDGTLTKDEYLARREVTQTLYC